MKTKTLLCLFLASIGLFALAVAGDQRPEQTSIENISASDLGEQVLIEGKILSSYSTGDTGFFTVSDGNENISVVSFDGRTHFTEGSRIRFSGRLTLYEGKLEVIAKNFYRVD